MTYINNIIEHMNNNFKNKSTIINDSSTELCKKLKVFDKLDSLPAGLKISTITVTCRIGIEFNVANIGKYVELSKTGIVGAKYGDGKNSIRSIVPITKKSKKKKKKPKNAFFNQTTLMVCIEGSEKYKNVKLFTNGSIQMTGCKNLKQFTDAIEKIFNELKKEKAVISPTNPNKIINKPFIDDTSYLTLSSIEDVCIRMINSNFKVQFNIDRESFYEVLLKDNIECSYEPIVHACVNIKYKYDEMTDISIFVFESGAIIITGAKERDHIIKAYNFIIEKLYSNFNKIIRINLDDILANLLMEQKGKQNISIEELLGCGTGNKPQNIPEGEKIKINALKKYKPKNIKVQ